ncbi:hypothetical protein V3429_16840 [Aeromonas jandaei]|uniref:hypothetical protein n=1 Tax=Aeromonas TaxID=642 RepID=UPI00090367BF|nr:MULTISPECIES: hypothetical protein [unclassified Aeromonas]QXC37873.1 hypothetical protein I6L40_18600 [Aeromonas sp. FDAARGOS 1410]
MRLLPATLLLLFPLLSACSSLPGQKYDGPEPLFLTHINEEGSKRFTFEAAPNDTLPRGLSAAQSQRLLELREALQENLLTQTLASKKYCREGYIVLSQTSWKVRGECNETATAADRSTFPNKASWQD